MMLTNGRQECAKPIQIWTLPHKSKVKKNSQWKSVTENISTFSNLVGSLNTGKHCLQILEVEFMLSNQSLQSL